MSETLKTLSRDDIRAARDMALEPVDVPEWGGRVWVRTMEAEERERYTASIRKEVGRGKKKDVTVVLEKSSAKLVQRTVCDEKGELLFTAEDIAWLATKSARAMGRVVEVAARLNGLSDEAEDDAKNDSASATTSDGSSTD